VCPHVFRTAQFGGPTFSRGNEIQKKSHAPSIKKKTANCPTRSGPTAAKLLTHFQLIKKLFLKIMMKTLFN